MEPVKASQDEASLGAEPHGVSSSAPYDQLARLYVAGLPKTFTETQLKPLFDQWGAVRDVMILRERTTGLSRGCAFVGFESPEEAEAAIQHLNSRVRLAGAAGPLEVRFARNRHFVPAGEGPEDNRQLFFSRAPLGASENELQALFARHGAVESINLFRDQDTRNSKGCGLVTMTTRPEAMAAMNALDEQFVLEGAVAPFSVKWADTNLRARRNSRAVQQEESSQGGEEADDRTVFFARVLRSADEDAVRSLFSNFGRVVNVNLFRAFQGAPTSKGCGLATMSAAEEATAAIAALHEQHTWEGMTQPMVVRWMDSALQRRRREEHMSTRQAAGPGGGGGGGGVLPGLLAGHPAGPAMARAGLGGALPGDALMAPRQDAAAAAAAAAALGYGAAAGAEVPPPGCAPDAYKLFIGNIPAGLTEQDLLTLFESVGPVAELALLYDKATGASKGSAFCWYVTRADADRAVAQLHEQRLLLDPATNQPRALVVRPASHRRSGAAGAQGAAPGGGGGSATSWVLGGLGHGARSGGGAPQLVQPLLVAGGGAYAAPDVSYGDPAAYAPPARVLPDGTQQPLMAPTGLGAGGGYAMASVNGTVPADAGGSRGAVYAVVASGPMPAGMGAGAPPGCLPVDGSVALIDGGTHWGMVGGGPVLMTQAAGHHPYHQQQQQQQQQQHYHPQQQHGHHSHQQLPQQQHHYQQPQHMQYMTMSPVMLAPAPPLLGSGDVVAAHIPLGAGQLQAVSPNITGIQNASGADLAVLATPTGAYALRISGLKSTVDTATQLVTSVLQHVP